MQDFIQSNAEYDAFFLILGLFVCFVVALVRATNLPKERSIVRKTLFLSLPIIAVLIVFSLGNHNRFKELKDGDANSCRKEQLNCMGVSND